MRARTLCSILDLMIHYMSVDCNGHGVALDLYPAFPLLCETLDKLFMTLLKLSKISKINYEDLNELMALIHGKYSINIIYSNAMGQAPGKGEDTFVRS